MKVIGLTGGIGSGKTTVAKIFEVLGVPVYYSDERARDLYFVPEIKAAVVDLVGPEAYFSPTALNRPYIASKVFSDEALLARLNDIIHPAVGKDFDEWLEKQNHSFVLKESAILFETGIYKKLDGTILVVSPEALRMERIAKRDKLSDEEVKKRFKAQLSDEQKIPFAQWIINNDEEHSLIEQSLQVQSKILSGL